MAKDLVDEEFDDGALTDVDEDDSVYGACSWMYKRFPDIKHVDLHCSSLKELPAFWDCTALTTVVLPWLKACTSAYPSSVAARRR